jgi:aspartate carbamoyltransferase catalytic subunit
VVKASPNMTGSSSRGVPRRLVNSKGVQLDPNRLLEAAEQKVDFPLLESLTGRSLVGVSQLDHTLVVELAKFAALVELTEVAGYHPLDGKLVVTAFFEASTRTRLSFESAVLRCDGKIINVQEGRVTGQAKGESLADIGEMLNTYGDLVVMRHPVTEAVEQVQRNLLLPLINAGNGSGEHPTQALVDWYTLLKWRPALMRETVAPEDQIHLGIIGTPGNMRAVKSFLLMALLFPAAIKKITVISDMVDPYGFEIAPQIAQSAVPIEHGHDAQEVIADLDVVYINSIALLGDSYKQLDARYKLTPNTPFKPEAVVMHPLARLAELDTSLDETDHNLYFAQAASAVFLRQALMIAILGRIDALPPALRLLTR